MPLDPLDAPEAAAWLRITFSDGLPLKERLHLLRVHGSAREALRAATQDPRFVESPFARVDDTLRWLEKDARRHLIAIGDARYPRKLLEIHDPPPLLFARGDPRFLNVPTLAIVGSRNATRQGCMDAESFGRALSDCGLCIASGLALGIDAAAHRGALAGRSSTVAVMGTGPDILYPASNRQLALDIEQKGCIVSEFPLRLGGMRRNFPQRNRLISGLSIGVLVVEASRDSGSLITAHEAANQGRDVMALPGSVHSSLSKGCHELIREGAKLVDGVEDVLTAIGWTGMRIEQEEEQFALALPDPVLDAVGFAPTSMDRLAEATGLPYPALAARLSRLEIEGRIASLAGGRFVAIKKRPRTRVIE